LCWITYDGRQILKTFDSQSDKENTVEKISPPTDTKKPTSKLIKDYPEFSWNLDTLEPPHVYIVQRQNVIEQIKGILENPDGRRIVFLWGQPQVGKTFVLEELQRILQDQYTPVFVHTNGWASTRKQSSFLYELALNIQYSLNLSRTKDHIKPFQRVSEFEATAEFIRFIRDISQSRCAEGMPFLLMFDELEYLAREEADSRIFEYLTSLVDDHYQQLRFIFAGSGDMLDLLEHGPLTEFWAKGQEVCIKCFEENVTRNLVIALTKPYFEFRAVQFSLTL
jgi:hypothetical protein